jgi:hypothetical protein
VQDEPTAEQFADVGKRAAAFHAADAKHAAYVNLMAWMNLDDYLSTVKPRFLSYDYYQWWWNRDRHFGRLEAHRRAALQAGIPLLCWIEGNADGRWEWGEKGQTYLPDNEPKLRQSVYTSLAYGVKGIQWFNAFVIFDHAPGRVLLPTLRQAGEDVKALNAELQALGPTLLRLRSADVFHTRPLAEHTRPLPADCWVQTRRPGLVLGLFDEGSGQDYAMVVNRSVTRSARPELTFAAPRRHADRLDRATGAWVSLRPPPGHGPLTVRLTLAPGDGELLRVR